MPKPLDILLKMVEWNTRSKEIAAGLPKNSLITPRGRSEYRRYRRRGFITAFILFPVILAVCGLANWLKGD